MCTTIYNLTTQRKNETIRKSANILSLSETAKRNASIFYHKTNNSKFPHLQDLGKS